VKFGDVPSGFRELARRDLILGQTYTVLVSSRGRGRGYLEFKIIEKDGKPSIVVTKEK